jgi:hypothetical protein
MSELSDRPVKITADERPHPTIRQLAQACIALAQQLSTPQSLQTPKNEDGDQTAEGHAHG